MYDKASRVMLENRVILLMKNIFYRLYRDDWISIIISWIRNRARVGIYSIWIEIVEVPMYLTSLASTCRHLMYLRYYIDWSRHVSWHSSQGHSPLEPVNCIGRYYFNSATVGRG